ncbi:ABC transporter permease [Beggiatoa leptomitoformis]|uniref:ABC transporter permease n=1 Tax=Beggiatoa leptomitoformis TaxID=288004 RepID=A0A2N9YCJ2_9GAMM|nr:ABC transporter permease [Beggiatoa leptomitoformis]ALG66520.1 ABC transporter permease [Beggiatoa leptomitoformis]AUI68183.1 ABC transporter permease [Beggiatoa leptomitoformis]
MRSPILTLAYYVLIEALRTRFFIVILLLFSIGLGITLFLGQITLIETEANQSSILAAFFRLSAVYLLSLFVITSMVREFNDHSISLFLSLPLSRTHYFLGKFLGFCLTACITALLFGMLLLFYADYQQVIFWTGSLFCELLIISTVSLLFVLSFNNTVQAFSAVLAFYLLARSINTLQIMSLGVLYSADTFNDQFVRGFIQLLALLLPDLEKFTQSAWLIYHTGTLMQFLLLLEQTLIYVFLLVMASLFDLYRKNL